MPLGLKFGLFKKVLDEFSFNFPPEKDLHNTERGIDQEREKLISFFFVVFYFHAGSSSRHQSARSFGSIHKSLQIISYLSRQATVMTKYNLCVVLHIFR